MSSRIEWITDPARFHEIKPAWDALAEDMPVPFGLHDWLWAWWSAFAGGRALAVCAMWRGTELTAAIPLLRHRGGLQAMANAETPSFCPPARGAHELAQAARAVAASARRLEVMALPSEGPALAGLLQAAREQGRLSMVEPQFVAPVTDTTGDFAAYRHPRRGRWRELERRGRKLRREHDVEIRLIRQPGDLPAELEEGLRLESSGWKGSGGTAILSSPQTALFYRSIARSFHARGQLRTSELRIGGRLAAFDLALLHGGRYLLLKTAYDESLRSLSPGLVLRRAVIEHCFERGLAAHEFLGVDMAWKRLFSTAGRPHCTYRGYPRRPLPAAQYSYRRHVRPLLRDAYRRLRPVEEAAG